MRSLAVLLGISFAAGAALAQNAAVPAFQPRPVYLPVIGLAGSETAQVNVVNLAVAPQNNGNSQAPSCTGTVAFYNAGGNAINLNSPTLASFTIGSGQIFSVALPYSEALSPPVGGIAPPLRVAVRAVVSLSSTDSPSAPCSLAANIETYDTATGVTHIHVESTTALFSGAFSFAGASRSQR